MAARTVCAVVLLGGFAVEVAGNAQAAPPAPAHGTILDLQEHSREETLRLGRGKDEETVRLVNLNAGVNAWYLLERSRHGEPRQVFNLENAHPREQRLHLSEKNPGTLTIVDYLGARSCDLWGKQLAGKSGGCAPTLRIIMRRTRLPAQPGNRSSLGERNRRRVSARQRLGRRKHHQLRQGSLLQRQVHGREPRMGRGGSRAERRLRR